MDTNKMQARLVLSLLGDKDEQIGFWYCITHITKDLLESKMYGQASYWLNYTGAHNIGDLSQRYNVLNAKADRFNESVIGLEGSLSKLPTIKYNTRITYFNASRDDQAHEIKRVHPLADVQNTTTAFYHLKTGRG